MSTKSLKDKLLELLSKGEQLGKNWMRPWVLLGSHEHKNVNGRGYNGGNIIVLAMAQAIHGYSESVWGTYKMIAERGGQIRKGEKATTIIKYSPPRVVVDEETGEEKRGRPYMVGLPVFNIDQADWPEGRPQLGERPEREELPTLEDADNAIMDFINRDGITLSYGGDEAAYRPGKHSIRLPEKNQFKGTVHYYATVFHELAHATNFNQPRANFMEYATEECVAELAAVMCIGKYPDLANDESLEDNQAAYLSGWYNRISGGGDKIEYIVSSAVKVVARIFGDELPSYDEEKSDNEMALEQA